MPFISEFDVLWKTMKKKLNIKQATFIQVIILLMNVFMAYYKPIAHTLSGITIERSNGLKTPSNEKKSSQPRLNPFSNENSYPAIYVIVNP